MIALGDNHFIRRLDRFNVSISKFVPAHKYVTKKGVLTDKDIADKWVDLYFYNDLKSAIISALDRGLSEATSFDDLFDRLSKFETKLESLEITKTF